MRYVFTGKNITITNAMKEKVTTKLDKLGKILPEDAEVFVTLSVVKLNHIVEVTVPVYKRILRAEVKTDDMYVAIDEVVDILEKQMIKYKDRLRHSSKKDNAFKDEYRRVFNETIDDDGATIDIERTKRFALKPMDAEEAVMEMEMLNHNFYVFRNGDSDEVNVVYKRKDGSYGLIEPEF